MIPTDFPEANVILRPPLDLEESQCGTVPAFRGEIVSGSLEGAITMITAWTPNEQEREDIANGKPIFLSIIGQGMPPHLLTTDINISLNPS